MSLKKALKRIGKKAKKAAKSVGKAVGTAARVLAPVAPIVLGATGVGLAVGAGLAVSGAALKGGDRKSKMKALKRTATHLGGAAVGTAALGAISGAGIGASALSSIKTIFNPAASAGSPSNLDNALLGDNPASSGGVPGSGLADAFLGSVGEHPTGVPGGSGQGSPSHEQGQIGDTPEGRPMDTVNSGNAGTAEPGKSGMLVAAGIGAAALLLAFSGRK